MIIKRLTTNNFFRFFGKYDFEFSTGIDKNVTVIRGENGTGKTTIINAFYWCLYGDVTHPLYIEKILNELAEHNIKDGETDEAFVEILIHEKGIDYTIKRKLTFKRRGDDVIRIGDESFTVTYIDTKTGNPKPGLDTKNFFDSFIPNNLRGFFFFDGERIDRLAQIDGRDEIKKAILDILGLTKLEKLKEFFDEIVRELTKEQKRYMSLSEQDLSDDYEALCKERDKFTEEMGSRKAQLQQTNENLREIERFLETHNSEIVKGLQSERAMAEQLIKNLKGQLDEKTKAKNRLITKEFKNNLIASCFDTVYEYLESKRQRGELPSDIKEQFIDDLITKGTCICGRPLEEGSPECLAVLAMKASAGRTELDDAYHRLTSYIRYQRDTICDFFPRYHAIDAESDNLEREIDAKNKRIKEIGQELKNSDEGEIAAKENLRDSIKNDIRAIEKQIVELEVAFDDINRKITVKDRQLKNVTLKGEQAGMIKKRREMTSRLGELNQQIRSYFIETTRINLDKRIREVFNSMKEKEYRYARLTDDFVLEITNDLENQEDSRILSTGEGQIASLAFIGSLVSYAREKMQDKLMSDFSGGDFPVVMDSPFGNLSTGHKGNVAREIGNLASQVIIIVSDEQWSSIVEENIKPKLGALYKMVDGDDEQQSIGEHTVVRRL